MWTFSRPKMLLPEDEAEGESRVILFGHRMEIFLGSS